MAGTMADVRAMRPGRPVASTTGQVEVLTVSLPPGSSLATTNSELNANYSEAQSNLAKAQASGDQAAIDRAQIQVNLKQAQLNTFVQRQNAPSATLDEKNIVDPATRNANANATTTTTTTAPTPVTEPNRDDRPAPANSTTQTAQVSTIRLVPSDNLLHNYSSYTYQFSLSALSATDYDTLINDPTRNVDELKNLLIASGGASQDKRAAYFKEDFYFDNVVIKTLFGAGASTRNTNMSNTTFTIIEPYGVTLLERLTKAVTELTESPNIADQPYLMTLNFWGYDDEALSPKKIESCTRHFIIKITDITFGLTAKGAEYQVTCQPYGHNAFNETAAVISSNFEVSAKTVREFFGDATDSAQAATVAGNKGTVGRDDRAETPTTPDTLTGSLSFVLNQDARKLKESGAVDVADEYVFIIDKEIADAMIMSADDKDIKGTPMKVESFKKYAAAASNKTITYDNDKRKIAVSAGTTLINLINDIVTHSTYVLDQIISVDDKEIETLKADTPISWLRIIPDVELLEFDKKRNVYAKRYIYNLLKFSVYAHNHEQMGQAPVPGVSKIYDYFYTGQNKDIIDLNIEYNAMYVNYVNSNRAIKAGSTPPAGIDTNPDKTDTTNPSGTAFPAQIAVSNSPALNSPSRASTNSNDLIVNDLSNSFLSRTGHMTEIDITIVGDPSYITQTDVFYGKFTGQFATSPILPDGSLNPCLTDIYALIRFNTPNDIDLENGIYDFTDKGDKEVTSSAFTGLYRVTTIESNFTGGKFTQKIHLMRMPSQSTDFVIESAAKSKFSKQDVSPENIKKLTDSASKLLNGLGGLGSDFSDIASALAPVKNLLNGRNLV